MQTVLGFDHLIVVRNHVSMQCIEDPFETPETRARAMWYGVDGIPTVWIDGKTSVVGAIDCVSAFQNCRTRYDQRIAETGGMCPVQITGFSVAAGRQMAVTATFRLLDPVSLSDLRATILVYEDGIEKHEWDFYDYRWNRITHVIRDTPVVLAAPGDEAVVHETIEIDPEWDPTRLRVVAYLQTTSGNREVVQSAMLPSVASMRFDRWIASVPAGNGTAILRGEVVNGVDRARTFVIEPGDPFGDWTSDFTICDGEPQSGPVDITLGPGESCPLELRIRTDGAREVREGGLRVTVDGLMADVTGRVFNESPAIYLIENDASVAATLDAIGFLHDDLLYRVDPVLRTIANYDIVMWDWVSWPDIPFTDVLGTFMDGGGSVLLASHSFLDAAGSTPFARDYLGVGRSYVGRAYDRANGMPGDPIGDGLDLSLADDPLSDCVMPDVTAQIVLMSNAGLPAAIRKALPGGARSVFMPFQFASISGSDPDPNNRATVMRRIVDWFVQGDLAGAPRVAADRSVSGILGVRPNPFRQGTQICFRLSARASEAPARLEIFDPAGRRVASLLTARLASGEHSLSWGGRTDAGSPVGNGVYFVKLSTADAVRTEKIIVVR